LDLPQSEGEEEELTQAMGPEFERNLPRWASRGSLRTHGRGHSRRSWHNDRKLFKKPSSERRSVGDAEQMTKAKAEEGDVVARERGKLASDPISLQKNKTNLSGGKGREAENPDHCSRYLPSL